MSNNFLSSFFLALFLLQAPGGGQTGTRIGAPTPNDQLIPLSNILVEIGSRYGYFFTIEEAWKDGGRLKRLESDFLERPSPGQNIQEALKNLSQLVPRVRYTIDKANPKIVHIIDSELVEQRGYALDHEVSNIDFKGSLYKLVGTFAQQGIPISTMGSIDAQDVSIADFKTVVQVKGKQLSIRSALSDFVPLDGRTSPILWRANTKLGPNATTYVWFVLGSIPSNNPKN